MPRWIDSGVTQYLSRLPANVQPKLLEVPRPKGAHKEKDRKAQCRREGQDILSRIDADDWVIALDPRGKPITTEQWAKELERWHIEHRSVAMIIGGSDGLAPEVLSRAQERWSLSGLTFPHMLVRVIVAEQWYRAWSLNQGLPYHK